MSDRSLFSIINRSRCANQKCSFCIGGVANLLGSALGSAWFHLVPCCKKCIIYNTLAWFLLGSTLFQLLGVWFLQHMRLVLSLAACVIYSTLAWLHLVPCCKKSCSGYGFYSTWGWFCVLLHVLSKQCAYGEGTISLEHEGHICADAMACLCHIQTNFCIKTSSSQSSHRSFSKRKIETKKN